MHILILFYVSKYHYDWGNYYFLLADYILASIILFSSKFAFIIQNTTHKVPEFIFSCTVWYIILFLGLFLTSKKWMQPIT